MADGSVTIGVSLDTTFFIHSLEIIEDRVNGLSSSLTSVLSDSLNNRTVLESAESAFGKIENSAVSAADNIRTTFSTTASDATDAFSGANWEESGSTAAVMLASGITAGLPSIMNAVSTIVSNINSAFSSDWNTIGNNISSGIASGVISGKTEVVTAAIKVSEDTENAFRSYYEIASPSALMRDEIGVMISRGIADGIMSGSSFIRSSLSSVYDASEINSRYSASGAEERNNSLTQNIYLRDSDYSPYRTAKRIRRESEAMFRI